MKKFMQIAIEEAEKGLRQKDGGPFGAVIIRNGKVIVQAHNEVLKNSDPTCHAEIQAIRAFVFYICVQMIAPIPTIRQ